MKKENLYKTPEKFGCRPPALFSIPLANYSDEMAKERDKNLFTKMKELEKKTQQLRQKIELLSQTQSDRLQRIQQMVAESYNINYRRLQRQIK